MFRNELNTSGKLSWIGWAWQSEGIGNIFLRFYFSSGEMKRKDDQLAGLDAKQDEARQKMQEIQIQLQKLQAAPN